MVHDTNSNAAQSRSIQPRFCALSVRRGRGVSTQIAATGRAALQGAKPWKISSRALSKVGGLPPTAPPPSQMLKPGASRETACTTPSEQDGREGRNEPASQPISATCVVREQAQRRNREDRRQRAEEHSARIAAQREPECKEDVTPERSPAGPWRRRDRERGQPDPSLCEDLDRGPHEQPRVEQEQGGRRDHGDADDAGAPSVVFAQEHERQRAAEPSGEHTGKPPRPFARCQRGRTPRRSDGSKAACEGKDCDRFRRARAPYSRRPAPKGPRFQTTRFPKRSAARRPRAPIDRARRTGPTPRPA